MSNLPGAIPTAVLYGLCDGVCKTMDELDNELHLNRRQISLGATKLIFRGLAERVEIGCFQLTTEGKKAVADGVQLTSGPIKPDRGACRVPHKDTLRQRAWNFMRMGNSFSIADLLMATKLGGEKTAENNLHGYLRTLVKHGYLIVLPRCAPSTKPTSNGFRRWRLLNDTGPIAPVWRRSNDTLFDHNLGNSGEVVSCK
ncbi:hypothetical protein PsAD14_02577 [Pseudovibrio sp. Ad14]|nr:hypothetical protein PsW74_03752 [Pseudovibrio sp. W74]KZL08998.1 hypothetical protein PsAD14_02577 [Pseudovibrio sp. Ad14]